jgi:hypothetical protein
MLRMLAPKRWKSFPASERPSLLGWVLRPFYIDRIKRDISSNQDNITKRLFQDETSLALIATATDLADKLNKHKIAYTFVGGFAINLHGFKRQTVDIDVVVTHQGLEDVAQKLKYSGIVPRFTGTKRSYRDPRTHVGVDFLVAGEFPGDGQPKAVAFPDPCDDGASECVGGVRVIGLPKLIDLKLASYLSAREQRMKDWADVYGLVKHLTLDSDFAVKVDPSVRSEFMRILEIVERESKTEKK